MNVLHANWSDGALCLWVESGQAFRSGGGAGGGAHPFAAGLDTINQSLNGFAGAARPVELELALPSINGAPIPSPSLAHAIGHSSHELDGEDKRSIAKFTVPGVGVEPGRVIETIDALLDKHEDAEAGWGDPEPARTVTLGPGVEFFAMVVQLARYLLAQERFVPMLQQQQTGALGGAWLPWMGDDATADLVAPIVESMPPAARAVVDRSRHDAWTIVSEMVGAIVDAECRKALIDDDMGETIDGRDTGDSHVAWLNGLLTGADAVPAGASMKPEMIRSVRGWIGGLEERGANSTWRLAFRLNEPIEAAAIEDLAAPPDDLPWHLSFHLRPIDAPDVTLDAVDVWALSSDAVTIDGHRVEAPQELLLAELGRASRLYRPLEKALDESEPVEVPLSTVKAYEFLREIKPLLVEQGFGVDVPDWWDSPSARLGARLQVEGDEVDELGEAEGSTTASSPQLGLNTLVNYRWEIAVGDVTLTLREFEQLAERKSPLVRVNGRWVEIRPEDVKAAIGFIRDNPGGRMRIAEALRLAYASDLRETGVPVLGMDVSGWVGAMLGLDSDNKHLPMIETPDGFIGSLRPYQKVGLSWLAFMERFGFGLCLADDMGLGKTIQLLALMVGEREQALRDVETGAKPTPIGPTLLVVPMSVVGNWVREAKRFTPSINVLVHHGVERLQGDVLTKEAEQADLVVTTYALANRDREQLETINWHRLVLDEAQNIKNPQAKQTTAVRSLHAERRIALTGTPVENRLTELWSIMEFLNPGYLGPAGTFRRRFSVPIERHRDQAKSEQLRGLVRPFILRRLKTDPDVVSDLPEKVESREYCHLTGEQAQLYESCVGRMLDEVDRSEGIHRRGLVLSTLIKLKQICNHPSQLLKDHDFDGAEPPDPARSGKAMRIVELLDEVVAEGHQALVFTQFRQMGKLLTSMLRHTLDRDVIFLHGGSSKGQREAMIEAFQRGDGSHPIFILSLKAGGVGLNLTAASHVIHYDRWWNPAVEDQATDRAYRIGQTKTVQVHKFVVSGTLEERIDEMIERKTELARNIIGAGERWLTELDTDQLRQILSLRNESIGVEES